MPYSPVAMFVYNRLDNTRKTLEHLAANTLANMTDVFVFSDGGKNEESWIKVNQVREYVKQFIKSDSNVFRSITLIERPENFYLERNIIEGISQVFEDHDTIIVLEDDIVTSPYYLQYMNQAFETYCDEPQVMHVSGFSRLDLPYNGTYFTLQPAGWGWGTWKDRWEKHFVHFSSREEALQGLTRQDIDEIQYAGVFPCLKSLDKNPIPWDICWEIAIHKAKALCLNPTHTLIRNIGLNQGTHYKWSSKLLQTFEYDRKPLDAPIEIIKNIPQKDPHIETLMKEALTDWGIRYTILGKIIRFVYKRLKK